MSLIKMQYKNLGFSIKVNDEKDIFCEYSAGYMIAIDQKIKRKYFHFLTKIKLIFYRNWTSN